MKDVLLKLATDFLSTIIFLVVYLATDNIILATSVAVAGAIAQVIFGLEEEAAKSRDPFRSGALPGLLP